MVNGELFKFINYGAIITKDSKQSENVIRVARIVLP